MALRHLVFVVLLVCVVSLGEAGKKKKGGKRKLSLHGECVRNNQCRRQFVCVKQPNNDIYTCLKKCRTNKRTGRKWCRGKGNKCLVGVNGMNFCARTCKDDDACGMKMFCMASLKNQTGGDTTYCGRPDPCTTAADCPDTSNVFCQPRGKKPSICRKTCQADTDCRKKQRCVTNIRDNSVKTCKVQRERKSCSSNSDCNPHERVCYDNLCMRECAGAGDPTNACKHEDDLCVAGNDSDFYCKSPDNPAIDSEQPEDEMDDDDDIPAP